jgi:phage terminase large subunit
MNKDNLKGKLTKKQIQDQLWRNGNLYWKCHAVQKEMYKIFYDSDPNSILVWLLARQSGKSYLLAILAIEQALRHKNSVIKLLTDTKLHLQSIFEPIFNEILSDCPEDIKPTYKDKKYTYEFYNGSMIQLAGSDNGHYERLRGQKSALVLVDEAGFCDKLDEVVTSVLLPTTTHTGGKIVLASTPPSDPSHDFHKFIEEAELNGTLIKKTIYDNPLLTKEQIDNIISKMGGEKNPKFLREYLCEIIRDEDNTVFPEFDDNLKKRIIQEVDRPKYYDTYVSMDLGFKDLTFVLFSYYDFMKDCVIIEDELVIKGKDMQLPNLAKMILDKEYKLWVNPLTNEIKKPKRISDINYIVTQELYRYSHGELNFETPKKTDKQAVINQIRVMLSQEKIIINPRCTNLIRHLSNCRWKGTTKDEFARSPDDGHYDGVDALVYLIRSINYNKNPYPKPNLNSDNIFVNKSYGYEKNIYGDGLSNPVDVYKKLFNIKKR